ncbi:MAG TPA: phosphotransferase [Nocardioidaceae bacterium]|nr:phosphotransferase [Nocardioidaceae bacterium]
MSRADLTSAIDGAFSVRPLAGGYSGETFLVERPGEPAVLRVYGKHPDRAAIDAALLHLVRGLIPVPRVLDLRRPDPAVPSSPAHLLISYSPGERLDTVLPRAYPELGSRLARSVAGVLTTLSGIPFLRPAMFVDADLRLSDDAAPADGLVPWLDRHVGTGGPLDAWDPGLLRTLRDMCAAADGLLDTVHRTCLVHSDFNPKNILVDPTSGEVTALLDWEFAHAGSPYADLGNLLRFDRGTPWAREILEHFVAGTPGLAPDPLTLAHASDLWALIDLAGRGVRNPIVERADLLLQVVARSGDLNARL